MDIKISDEDILKLDENGIKYIIIQTCKLAEKLGNLKDGCPIYKKVKSLKKSVKEYEDHKAILSRTLFHKAQ